MNSKGLVLSIILALAGVIATNTASAYSTRYWISSTGGTWNSGAGSTCWSYSANTTCVNTWPAPWDTGQSTANATWCDAHFWNTTTYTVTMSGAVEASGLFFDAGTVTLAGSAGIYFCGGGGAMNVASGVTAYINTPVGGAVGIFVGSGLAGGGPGTLVLQADNVNGNGGGLGPLTGASSYSTVVGDSAGCSCVMREGTLAIGNNNALGTGALLITAAEGAASIQAYGSARIIANPVFVAGSFTVDGSLPFTFSGPVAITNSNPTITVNNQADTTITGAITDLGHGFTLGGYGRLVLPNGNAYTGTTTISGGNLVAANTSGSATGSGTVQINANGTLTGFGAVGPVSVNSGGVIVPGNFPSSLGPTNLTTGNLTLAGGGHYFWEINNATGTAGVNWSKIACGALSITATSSAPFVIDVTLLTSANGVGLPANFNAATPYSWTIAAATSITGFNSNAFAFTSSAGPASAFSVSQSGNNLLLNYTPPAVPGVVTTLYNAGLGAGGALLAPGATDAHWTLTTSPDATYTGPTLYAVQNNSVTWNMWKSAPYSWDIGPRSDAGNLAPGNYTYSSSFDLTGFNPRQVMISGRFSADDSVASVSINGVPTGISGSGFTAWTPFTIPDGLLYQGTNRVVFQQGSNNVQIVVNNAGSSANPSGFNLEWSAWLTSIVPPQFVGQTVNTFSFPSGGNLDVTPNSTVTFTATATATDSMNYQWKRNGNALSDGTTGDGAVITGSFGTLAGPGQSTTTMTIANFGLNESGTYSCLFSNVDGSTNAVGVLVQPATAPVILTNPVSLVVGLGTNASFGVLAAGPSLAYQWSHNSTPVVNGGHISGATAATLALAGALDADAGTYVCAITNSYGSTNTLAVALTVIDPPVITAQPTNQLNVIMTSNAAFQVVVTGTGPLAYQWYWNGNKVQNGGRIAGATSPNLAFTGVAWDAGTYTVTISNFAGITTSSAAVLTLNPNFVYESFEEFAQGDLEVNGAVNNTVPNPWFGPSPPNCHVDAAQDNVNPQLGSQMVGPDADNTADNDQNWLNLSYRMGGGNNLFGNFVAEWWFYDPAGTGSSAANYNDYNALCEYGSVPTTSDYGSTGNIGSIGYVTGGQRLSLGALSTQSGLSSIYYQARIVGAADSVTTTGWYNLYSIIRSVGWHHARIVMGVPDGANTLASFFIDNMAVPLLTKPITTTTGFNLFELGSGYGSTTGWYDDLSIRAAVDPWIIEQPVSVTVSPGYQGTFNIVANGSGYQWYENGTAMGGQTSATLSASDLATYTCVVTGTQGSVTSAPVVLANNSSIGTGTGLQGAYYNDVNLGTNDPAGAVCDVIDSQVYFDGTGLIPPSCPGIYGTNFSVRWTGLIQPTVSDTYTFYTMTDDGVRLYVNGQLVVNHWVPQAPTEWWSAGIPLQGGQFYSIEMDYFQAGGGDYYSLSWASDNVAKQLVPTTALYPYGGAPVITTDVQNQNTYPGGTATFTVAAGGAMPLSYQWFLNNTSGINQAIAGATNTTLELDNVQLANGLNYYFVVVANSYGSTNSSMANLFVEGGASDPFAVIIPQSQTGAIGGTVTFTARATGTPSLGSSPWFTYQWYFNDNTTINGATGATLTLTNLQTSAAGGYSVDVNGGAGDYQTDDAILTVVAAPPANTNSPVHISGFANGTLNYSGGSCIKQFVLVGTNNLAAPLANWTRLATNTATPGSFTVSPGAGRDFFRIKSE